MKNKVIFITGSTDGLGQQAALELAKMGATLIIHGRSQKRLTQTQERIKKAVPMAKVSPFLADFESLKQVSQMCDAIKNQFSTIDVLFYNAATFSAEKKITTDGLEINFQVNHLCNILINNKLESLLRNSENARVIFMSSMLHANDIDFDNLQGEKTYLGNQNYALSKLCNILTANYLSKYFADTKITVNSAHPGVVETKLLNATWSGGESVEIGATKLVYLATSKILNSMTGSYFENGRPMQSNPISYDESVQEKLWKISQNLLTKYL